MKPEIAAVRLVVPPKDIYYISWIIDAAEGVGFLQTDDAKAGRITVFSPREQQPHIMALVESLRGEGIEIKTDDETNDTGEAEI